MQTFSRKGESDVILCQLNMYFFLKKKKQAEAGGGAQIKPFHFEAAQL